MGRWFFLRAAIAPIIFFVLMALIVIAFYKPDASYGSALYVLDHFMQASRWLVISFCAAGLFALWYQTSHEGWNQSRQLRFLGTYAVFIILMMGSLFSLCKQTATNLPGNAAIAVLVTALMAIASCLAASGLLKSEQKESMMLPPLLLVFFSIPVGVPLFVWHMISADYQASLAAMSILFLAAIQGLVGFIIDTVRLIPNKALRSTESNLLRDEIDERLEGHS